MPTPVNPDAQNLDTRAILLAFRPLDPIIGHLLIDRAVTNQMRSFYRDKSTFLLEARRPASGWKTILRIEPERGFLISQFFFPFEAKPIVEMDIDYIEDPKWGWVPSGWRITQMVADGSVRTVTEAKMTSYSINQPISADEFRQGDRSQ